MLDPESMNPYPKHGYADTIHYPEKKDKRVIEFLYTLLKIYSSSGILPVT
jgi:hypothetical protein